MKEAIEGGVYNPSRRFAFTNITDDLFTFHWDGKPISVKSHQTIELPHHLAIIATNRLVDKILVEESKADEVEGQKVNPLYRSRKGIALGGVPTYRKTFEDKILRELLVDEESPQIAVMRAQIREQLKADIENSAKPAAPVSSVVSAVQEDNFSHVGEKVEFPEAKKKKK